MKFPCGFHTFTFRRQTRHTESQFIHSRTHSHVSYCASRTSDSLKIDGHNKNYPFVDCVVFENAFAVESFTFQSSRDIRSDQTRDKSLSVFLSDLLISLRVIVVGSQRSFNILRGVERKSARRVKKCWEIRRHPWIPRNFVWFVTLSHAKDSIIH
jgi:hypothetical protein